MDNSNSSSEPEEGEEDENDGLHRLFFSCSSISSSCEDDSEVEWREAVRQALEADIQYQVRLRLALDSPQLRTGAAKSSEQEQQILELCPQRRANVRVDHDNWQVTKEEEEETRNELVASAPVQELHEVGGAGAEKSEGERATKLPKISEKTSDTSSVQQKAIENSVLEVKKPAGEKTECIDRLQQLQQVQTVFDYLHLKYGTPYNQLEHLANHGCFKCSNGENKPVDSRMRWPKERPIVISGPRLVMTEATQSVSSEATNFSSSSVDAQSSEGISVYDCNMEDSAVSGQDKDIMESPGNNQLRFESRFESGNLHQAMQV